MNLQRLNEIYRDHQQAEISEIEKSIKSLEKQKNTRTDIIYNLFSQLLKDEVALDYGIDISKEYGHKYIDEWNKLYEEIFQDVVKTMNKCEEDLYGFHLEYNGHTHFDICVNDEEDDDEEDDDDELKEQLNEESQEKSYHELKKENEKLQKYADVMGDIDGDQLSDLLKDCGWEYNDDGELVKEEDDDEEDDDDESDEETVKSCDYCDNDRDPLLSSWGNGSRQRSCATCHKESNDILDKIFVDK